MHVRNRRKIYTTVEIHLWCLVSSGLLLSLVPSNNWQKKKNKKQIKNKKQKNKTTK